MYSLIEKQKLKRGKLVVMNFCQRTEFYTNSNAHFENIFTEIRT